MKLCRMFGHKFQARYHVKPGITQASGCWSTADLEAVQIKTYVHDICTRCGLIIKGE